MQFFARLRSRKKIGGSRLFRYGWKVTLLILLAGAGFAIFHFYGTWAQTFDMKNVGEMPERNTVYDGDGKIYNRLAGGNPPKVSLKRVQAEPARGGAPGRIDPQPQSIFTVKESGRLEDPTQCRSGSDGGIEKTFVAGCGSRQACKDRAAP